MNGHARLTNYPKGRIEVYKDGKWGTLCGHFWYVPSDLPPWAYSPDGLCTCCNADQFLLCHRWDNEHGASNICKQLGYPAGGTKYNAPGGSGPIVAGYIKCEGGEATVFDCPRKGDPSTCSHKEDQGVDCKGERGSVTEHQRKLDQAGILFRLLLSAPMSSLCPL